MEIFRYEWKRSRKYIWIWAVATKILISHTFLAFIFLSSFIDG